MDNSVEESVLAPFFGYQVIIIIIIYNIFRK